MKRSARDSKRQPQKLEARTLTTPPPSPLFPFCETKIKLKTLQINTSAWQSHGAENADKPINTLKIEVCKAL